MTTTIKVAARSRTASVAGSIAGTYREHGFANVQAIGAGAVNQAVKAITIARGYLADEELNIFFVPAFVDVEISGETRIAIHFSVRNRDASPLRPKDSFAEDQNSLRPIKDINQLSFHNFEGSEYTPINSSPKAILIIDDNLEIREALIDILSILPEMTFYTATNGQEGLQIFSQHQKQIVLVLLDMNMPILNGQQTYEGLLYLDPKVRVIVSSSLEKVEAQIRFGKRPLPTFLHKPYEIQTLLDTVKTECT